MKACAIQSFDAILYMVEKLKLVEEIKVVGFDSRSVSL